MASDTHTENEFTSGPPDSESPGQASTARANAQTGELPRQGERRTTPTPEEANRDSHEEQVASEVGQSSQDGGSQTG